MKTHTISTSTFTARIVNHGMATLQDNDEQIIQGKRTRTYKTVIANTSQKSGVRIIRIPLGLQECVLGSYVSPRITNTQADGKVSVHIKPEYIDKMNHTEC